MDIDAEMEAVLRRRAKALLRQRARALRNTIPAGSVAERSRRIAETLEALPLLTQARSVALFAAMEARNEVDLGTLGARLREQGIQVAYPAIDPDTRIMTFRFPRDPDAMQERGLGFREPSPEEPEAQALDVIVVPALQIDPTGHRIGYGAGYYDRTLPRFCPPAQSIGVAFDFQIIPEVPFTENDVQVDLVVTDGRMLDPHAPPGPNTNLRGR
jgi:5-formyltetrahydrofolate cyclo-ligase